MTPNQIRFVGFLSLPCGRDTSPTTPGPFTAGVFIVRALFTATVLLTLATSAQAQTNYTWDPGNSASGGTDSSGNWGTSTGDWYTTSDAQDWVNVASTSANNAIFGEGGTAANTVTLNTAIDANLMTFQSMGTGGSYTINSSFDNDPLTIYSGITLNPGAGPVTLNSSSGVSLGAASIWTNNSSSLLTVSSRLTDSTFGLTVAGTGNTAISGTIGAGSGSVSMSGSGILTLSSANTFTGGLIINSGTVVAGVGGAVGPSNRAITLGASGGSNAATLLAGSFMVSNPITLGTTTGTLTIGTNGGATAPSFAGGVVGTNNLILNNSGTGTLTFSTISLNNAGTISNVGGGTGTTTISGGIGNNVTAVVESSATSALTISGRLAVNSTSGTTLTSSTGAALLKLTGGTSGSGTLFLENNSATAGGITISTGTVSNKVVTNSGTGTGSVLISAAISAGGIIENSSISALTISGQLTASSGSGTTLTNSSGTAPLTLSGGVTGEILVLNNNSATAGGITISGPGSISIGGTLTNSGTGTGSTSISAIITDVGIDGGVVQNSSTSSLYLSGANTYSEGTTVSSGTLLVGISSLPTGSGGNLSITSGATGTGPVTVNSGTLDLSTFNLAVGGLNGSGGTVASSSASTAGSLTIVTNDSTPNSSYSGIIADTAGAGSKTVSVGVGGSGLAVVGGAQTFAGANTYSGGTTVTGGELVIGVSSVTTGSGAALSITSGATGTGLLTVDGGRVDLSTFNLAVAGLSGSSGVISSSTGALGSLTIVTGATAETYSGQIGDGNVLGNRVAVSVTVDGTGSQVLSGNSAYSGGTFVNGGTLTVSGAYALGGFGPNPVYGPLQVNNPNTGAGTAVVLNVAAASSITTGSLSGTIATPSSGTNTATINIPAGGTLTINQTTPGTFAGTIAGAGTFALGINSNSNLTLSGTNTFTGGLVIDAGTVIGTNAAAFGTSTSSSTGVIRLGNPSVVGMAVATLSGGFNGTFNNPISVSFGAPGQLQVTDSAASAFSGAVTLNGNPGIGATSDLTIAPAASNITLSGGFAGTGNLTIANSGMGTTTLSTNSVNNVGEITNSGTGGGGTIISAVIGPNVTGVIQNSSTSSLTLSGPNTYTGGTGIVAGTLVVSAISDTGVSNIGGWPTTSGYNGLSLDGGTLQYTGAGSSTTARQVVLGVSSTVLVTGGSLSNLALNGFVLDNGPNFPKSSLTLGAGSNGILSLGGANSYFGGTLVNAGTLLVTNTSGSATGFGPVNVSSGAVLGGGAGGTSGIINGLVTINGGGSLAPNGFTGTASTGAVTNLTLERGLNLSNGSILDYILGTSSDLVTLGAGQTLTLGTGVTLNVTQGSGFSAGTTYALVHFSALPNNNSSNFSGWTANGGPSGDTATFSIDPMNGNLDVKFGPPINYLSSYSGGPGGPFGTVATTSVSTSGSGSSYAGITSAVNSETSFTPAANGFGPTLHDDETLQHNLLYDEVLVGSNSGNFTGNGAATVSMAWRNRTLQETTIPEGGTPNSPPLPAASSALISNVLNLAGMSTSGGEPVQTDPFVLQMNYDTALLGNEAAEAASGAIYLAWLNPNGGGISVPLWQNAITGDIDGLTTPGTPIYLGSFLNYVNGLDGNANFPLFTTTYTTQTLGNLTNAQLEEILGDWGVDTANHDVWAVIDHNSEFAVAVVPEPATLTLAACGFFGLLGYVLRRRRRES